jgi:uroporphyrinogen-III decarboxylase
MTSRQRLLTALTGGRPDRLPVTTHHVMPYYLERTLGGMGTQKFFDEFGFDALDWVVPHRPDPERGEFPDPLQGSPGFLESRRVATDEWRVFAVPLGSEGDRKLTRYRFVSPGGELSMVIADAGYTAWVVEPLIKRKSDIDWIGRYVTAPKCDVAAVNRAAEAFGERGLIRGHICCFDVFGQPGCWQDACCLVGPERLVMEAMDDPSWVDELLTILQQRKRVFIDSLAGARYDVLELGGGDGSASVISPKLFERFVAPYDAPLIEAAHRAGQRIVYHLCGRIMPMCAAVKAMRPDAVETFTPAGMGGDADLKRARTILGDGIAMIGGFDQFHFFNGCTKEATRAEVRRCFQEAGEHGGYILCPSDHFFEAEPQLLHAFTDEAARCTYAG